MGLLDLCQIRQDAQNLEWHLRASGHVCGLFGMYVIQKARVLSSALPSELVQLRAFKAHWDVICQCLGCYVTLKKYYMRVPDRVAPFLWVKPAEVHNNDDTVSHTRTYTLTVGVLWDASCCRRGKGVQWMGSTGQLHTDRSLALPESITPSLMLNSLPLHPYWELPSKRRAPESLYTTNTPTNPLEIMPKWAFLPFFVHAFKTDFGMFCSIKIHNVSQIVKFFLFARLNCSYQCKNN